MHSANFLHNFLYFSLALFVLFICRLSVPSKLSNCLELTSLRMHRQVAVILFLTPNILFPSATLQMYDLPTDRQFCHESLDSFSSNLPSWPLSSPSKIVCITLCRGVIFSSRRLDLVVCANQYSTTTCLKNVETMPSISLHSTISYSSTPLLPSLHITAKSPTAACPLYVGLVEAPR